MYNTINIYIARSLTEHKDNIHSIVSSWSNNIRYYPIDSKCNTENKMTHASLSIVLINQNINDRYTLEEWFDLISKDIYLHSDNALFIVFAQEQRSNMKDVITDLKWLCYNESLEDIFITFMKENKIKAKINPVILKKAQDTMNDKLYFYIHHLYKQLYPNDTMTDQEYIYFKKAILEGI